MKIGILIDRLNFGGVEKIAIEEVIALRESGSDTSLIVLNKKAIAPNVFPDLLKNIPIIYLDERLPRIFHFSFKIPGFHFFSLFHLTYPLLLPFVIKRKEFDYIIAHGTYTALSAVAFKKRNDIHFSAFIWDPASYILSRVYSGRFFSPILLILRNIATRFDTFLIANMDTVLVGGSAHNSLIHKLNPNKNIITIYPSVHPIAKQSSKEDYILMVTAWKEGKNPEYIFNILKEIPDLRIKMVGKWIDPHYKERFEKEVTERGYAHQIDIVGAVSESELSTYYKKALLLLQTNDDKGFGMPAIEAAGHGTTFIIPKGQGVCELFTDKIHGFYTKEHDTKQITSLLRKLKDNPYAAHSMGKEALTIVKQRYSWKNHASDIKELVRKSIGQDEKTMHVLFTGLVSPKMLSGGDQLVLDIVPRLPEAIKIIIVTPHFARSHWKNIDRKNIEFRFLPPNSFDLNDNPVLTFLSYIIRSWQTYRILRSEKIQTIYSCSDIAYADIWPAYFAVGKASDIKWLSRVYHVLLPPGVRQGNHLTNIIAYRLQRLSFMMMKKRSTAIFSLNPKLYDELINLGFPKSRLGTLGAGVDFKEINRHKPNKKYDYDAVILGRIAPVKGIYDAVKIWEKVHGNNPNLKLAWIGGGQESYRQKLNEKLVSKSLTDSFHLLGFIDKKEIYDILKCAKVYLCTDHEIGWGLAVCEAMAAGLPVVTYDNDVFGSVYKKGFVSVKLFDVDSFAHETIELLANKKRRGVLAKEAMEQAKEYDHNKVIDALVNYIT